jgi:hypothetical protein
MSHRTCPRFFTVTFVTAALFLSNGMMGLSPQSLSPLGSGIASAQIDAGYLADVEDLKLTTAYSSLDDRTDVSLALALGGRAGGTGVTMMLRARFDGRKVDVERLSQVIARAHYRVLSDDRTRASRALSDSHALRMNLDSPDPSGISLAFFPATWGYFGFTAAGDEIPVAYFSMTPADLRALSVARTVTGHVLWTDFVLTPAQLERLRMFANQVLPPRASP